MATKKKPIPTNKALYARVKAETKRKFKVKGHVQGQLKKVSKAASFAYWTS